MKKNKEYPKDPAQKKTRETKIKQNKERDRDERDWLREQEKPYNTKHLFL
jgi:hypothetical protein